MKIKLHSGLEKALLRSIAEGVCDTDIVTSEELSKGPARQTYESMVHLLRKKVELPLKPGSILLTAQSLFGVDEDDFKTYLRSFKDIDVGKEIYEIARTAREKALLVRLINEAGTQLAQGHLNPTELVRLMESNNAPKPIQALSMSVQDKFPEPTTGISLRSLPNLSEAARGLIGVWIIGGEPGLGKSTLAFQIGLDAASTIPVLYYDLDGTGHEWLLDRCRRIAGGSVKAFRKLTQNFYLRETVGTLDDDLRSIRNDGHAGEILVCLDSLQTLPTSIKYKKESLDSWINKFKQLTKKKIVFVCVSEQNRAGYGEARMSSFKGTGDIEYAGSLCVQLLQPDSANDEDDPVQAHVVKNRHGIKKGHFIDLVRDKDKEFWFNEEEAE
jgi:hypothetical protein